MKLLVDKDVMLDVLLKREPFYTTAEKILSLPKESGVEKYFLATAVTHINYTAYRQIKNRETVRDLLYKVLQTVKIVAVTAEDIHAAFALNWKDFEDSVQYAVAKSNHFDAIVTRNMEGFDADDAVKIFTPEEFCKHIDNTLKE